jgi:peptide/nickel transport system substrate-binding protein
MQSNPETQQEREERIVRQFYRLESHFAKQGVSRRQLLRMIAAGGAAATVMPILLAACGDDDDDDGGDSPTATTATDGGDATEPAGSGDATEPADGGDATEPAGETEEAGEAEETPADSGSSGGEGQQGGTILIGTLGEAQTINPLLTNESEGTWRAKLLFDEFIELDPETLAPRPNLAAEWTISDDALEYTFTLQDNILFSDGEQLTAEDIEFTLYGILAEGSTSPYVARFNGIAGAADFNAGTADAIEGIEVVDDLTIVMRLTEPNAAFITNLRFLRPLPKHLLDGKDLQTDAFFQSPIGAGPFVFESWQTGQDFVAVRNENYWQEGLPYLDSFTHRTIADAQTLAVALETGEIDGSNYALPTQTEQLEAAGNLVILTRPFDIPDGWAFSAQNNEALGDARVRRAIAMALDMETFANDFLLGLGQPGLGPIAPVNWAHDPNLEPIPYDPDGARALLEEAGVTDLTIRCTTNAGNVLREDFLTYTQAALQEIGITVQPDLKEWTQVVAEATDGTFEVLCPTWSGATIDPDELYLTLKTGESRNVYGYSNPELDDLLVQGRAETDLEARKEIYSQVQQILMEDVPCFWAWYRPFVHVTTDAFDGYQNSILGFFQELEYWYTTA